MKRGLLEEYFKGQCFHSQGQFKATRNESAQNILGKAQLPADWCRTFSLVNGVSVHHRIVNVEPLSKLQVTSYLYVSYITYQEEHKVCRFWMMQLDVGLSPPLPASNLGSTAAQGRKRIDPRFWP